LIADDDSTMQAALSESVRRLGYDVHLASDGHEALERAMVLKPWLVLSDLKMPRLGGIPFVRELKKRLPETTIVLMTAYGTVETAVEAMKVGASDYLLKPFSADLLERILTNLQGSDADPSDTEAARTPQRPILTQDPGMIRLLSTAESVAASQATAGASSLRGGELRRLARRTARKRALRPRAGGVHRRARPQAGQI
jgi:two-component system response regulator FlrC